MKDILAVSLNKTYKKGMSEEELEKITKEAWILNSTKVSNIKYIVGFKDKKIMQVYKVNNYRPIKIRYRFDVEKADEEIKEKIKQTLDNQVNFLGGNPVRYFNSEDLK